MPKRLRRLFRARRVLAIVTAVPIAVGLEALGTFKSIEPKLAPFIAAATVLKADSGVVLVAVDDDDLRKHFNRDRTLEPEDLREILQVIAAAHPRVIGMDFLTSRPEFAKLAGETFENVPVVWARASQRSKRTGKSYVSDVLGGSTNVLSALVELPEEEDQMVRQYQRSFDTDLGDMWFLPCALIGDAQHPPPYPPPGTFLPIKYHEPRPEVIWYRFVKQQANQLKGKAVVVGATYRGLDEHKTPLGWWPGVEILTEIAETDSPTAQKPNAFLLGALIYLFAVATAAAFLACPKWWLAVCAGLGVMLAASFLFQSFFGSMDQTLYLIATLTVVLAAEIRGRYLDWRKEQDDDKLIEKIKAEGPECSCQLEADLFSVISATSVHLPN
jgi:CHASE2 domain-containing sensor protein